MSLPSLVLAAAVTAAPAPVHPAVPATLSAVGPFLVVLLPLPGEIRLLAAPAGLCAGQLFNRDWGKAALIGLGAPLATAGTGAAVLGLKAWLDPCTNYLCATSMDLRPPLLGFGLALLAVGAFAVTDAYVGAMPPPPPPLAVP